MKCDNIEKIKIIHKAYFDNIIINQFENIIKNDNLDTNIIDFIREFFFNNNEINAKLLEDICYGEREKLEEIISKYKKKTETYFYRDKFEECVSIINNYIIYLINDGHGKEIDRFTKWKEVIENIKPIINDLEYKEFINKIKIDILNEDLKIQNYSTGQANNAYSYNFKFSKKDHIQKYVKEFEKIFSVDDKLKNTIQQIFNYSAFRDNEKKINVTINEKNIEVVWNRHKLITMMGINVCPYCNRQFISSYVDNDKTIKTTADLDHFYSQDEYPFLAVSLYNFIPSCQLCNSRFKIADDFYSNPHIYPFTEEFGREAQFMTSFYTDEDKIRKESSEKLEESDKYDISYLLGSSDNFKIELKPKDKNSEIGTKIQNSIDTFHLEELYNFHKDYIRELIKKAIVYNESRIEELYTQYPELFVSKEDVMQMILSNYINDEDLGKRPLAKLTKDICEELGLR